MRARPWAKVWRVPTGDGVVWAKACQSAWAFEARLTAELSTRWGDRVTEVLASDPSRGWLLLADAGQPIAHVGNPPEAWLAVLPAYAELQRGEVDYAEEHIARGVPDLRLDTVPERYAELVAAELPLGDDEKARLRRYAPTLAVRCAELVAAGVPASIQHDDLHHRNVCDDGVHRRVVDWGDASVGHPFISLVVTFRFLEEVNGLSPDDRWFARLRDAYLEPWGTGLREVSALALQVGHFVHPLASLRARAALPEADRADFDVRFRTILRRALDAIPTSN